MLKDKYPYYLASEAVYANTDLAVTDKYSREIVTRCALADEPVINKAIEAAVAAEEPMRSLAGYERQAILNHCVKRFEERSEELARTLCIEAGKPIQHSRGEAQRLIDTFRIAAEESVRQRGEITPLDRIPRARGYVCYSKRVAIGACSFISPFNFPLNLAAHKIAPAIAAGCPFILKPASSTPLGALIIGETLAETDLPRGAFSILPCKREGARLFTEDERLKLLSFTGSAEVGWELKRKAGKKRVVLELGGNAGCIVERDADVEDAAKRILFGAFYQSGQSCISVQRIVAHESIYPELRDRLVRGARELKTGRPIDEETFIGPLITEDDARRIESWIESAVRRGARLLCGGKRDGAFITPALLENVPDDESLCAEEAFGPVAVMKPFTTFDEALDDINHSRFGLQAGVFTNDVNKAHQAWDRLVVGGVTINEIPSWRADEMPYGGVKDSGFGREGIRCAIEDMTENRIMVIRLQQN
ncbi:MAG: aldehyde dehydrogenase family protein [bacterium]|nr:aldehyde dehydrogenase family protein [bacterium]